jgi:hypothetical protein
MNVHACRSWDTLAEEIVEAGAMRVLARSPLGYGHDPLGAAPGAAAGLLVPQAASSAPSAITASTPAVDLARETFGDTDPGL